MSEQGDQSEPSGDRGDAPPVLGASDEEPAVRSEQDCAEPADAEPGSQRLDQLIAARRAKAARLRERAGGALPYAYPGATPVALLQERFAELAPGAEGEQSFRVAGRLHARRGQGALAFLDLVDRTGKIQLLAGREQLGAEVFGALEDLDLGDWVGAAGLVMRSRRGELSLRLSAIELLGKALRPPPDKHHGLSDVELRLRMRELDLMSSAESRERFVARAKAISGLRAYLDQAGFIEVETPVLQPLYGGALARPFTTHHNELQRDLYLRIATELYLKRLIVGGLERVYELGKDFRNEGVSHKHNPEFTMVELYEAYADYNDAAARLEAIVAAAAAASGTADPAAGVAWRRLAFMDAIEQATGLDLRSLRDAQALRAAISAAALDVPEREVTWPEMADALLSKYVEPELREPTFIVDYPIELSPLARAHRDDPSLAERWEAFVGGMEIANAFSELTDPDIQRQRFEQMRRLGAAGAAEGAVQPYDEQFIESLEYGMPPTGGIGIGIDRLVMALTGCHSIREVVLFPALRPRG